MVAHPTIPSSMSTHRAPHPPIRPSNVQTKPLKNYLSFHGKLIATGFIVSRTNSATSLASNSPSAFNTASAVSLLGPCLRSLNKSNPSPVNSVAANHETIHRSVVPSSKTCSPHPKSSHRLLRSASNPLPRQSQTLQSPDLAAVSIPAMVLTVPFPERDSYSTRSSMRSCGGDLFLAVGGRAP